MNELVWPRKNNCWAQHFLELQLTEKKLLSLLYCVVIFVYILKLAQTLDTIVKYVSEQCGSYFNDQVYVEWFNIEKQIVTILFNYQKRSCLWSFPHLLIGLTGAETLQTAQSRSFLNGMKVLIIMTHIFAIVLTEVWIILTKIGNSSRRAILGTT